MGLNPLRIATAIAIGDPYVDVTAGSSAKSNARQCLKDSTSQKQTHTCHQFLLGNTIDVGVRENSKPLLRDHARPHTTFCGSTPYNNSGGEHPRISRSQDLERCVQIGMYLVSFREQSPSIYGQRFYRVYLSVSVVHARNVAS